MIFCTHLVRIELPAIWNSGTHLEEELRVFSNGDGAVGGFKSPDAVEGDSLLD